MMVLGIFPASALAETGAADQTQAQEAAFRITAPTEATVQVFRQGNFHQITPLERLFANDLGNGTSVFGFPAGGTHYRVSMDGKITRTGFTTSGDLTVTFGTDEDPQTQEHINTPQLMLRMEASTMVNINTRNHRTMHVGETFRLRGYRAAWEIIDGDTTNMIVQPDFHINILSGTNVIDIASVPNQSNWFDITARQAGTAIIEVYYDAIRNINGGNDQLFAATNPVRRSIVVITVGENTGTIDFGTWDTEFDTVYYLNTQKNGYFPLDAAVDISTVQVAHISNRTLGSWQPISVQDGEYRIPVFAGNNLVRVTDNSGRSDYQVVRAAQITPVVANLTNPGQAITPGDRFTLRFEGLFTPAPKLANVYNPTLPFMGEVAGNQISYTFNGTTVSAGAQYTFPNQHTMTFTAPATEGNFTISNGRLSTRIFGFGGGFGTHRYIGDNGTANGGSAPTFSRVSSILPDVPITIGTPGVTLPGVDKSALRVLVNRAQEISSDKYTQASFSTLQTALTAAITIRDNEDATQAMIDAAKDKLNAAITALVETLSLHTAITQAESLTQADYTPISWAVLQIALTEARTVHGKASATQVAVNGARDTLNTAIAMLVAADTGTLPQGRATMSVIDPNYHRPGGARVFLPSRSFDLNPGETVYDLLRRTDLTIISRGHPTMGMYVANINGWGEFSDGPLSGWMFRVNGVFPDHSSSVHVLRDGDRVEWLFTRDLGDDISGSFIPPTNPGGGGGNVDNNDDEDMEEDDEVEETGQNPFADVVPGSWYFNYVQFVYENNLMQGMAPRQFSPHTNLSRAMTVTILWRLAGEPIVENSGAFHDVQSERWYSDAVAWASEYEIVQGFGDSRFGPHDDVTREQMAVIFRNFARHMGQDIADSSFATNFSDVDDISAWAFEALEWANANGLINGRSLTRLVPRGTSTRAESSAMLQRFIEHIIGGV